jgi:hypothetical protein
MFLIFDLRLAREISPRSDWRQKKMAPLFFAEAWQIPAENSWHLTPQSHKERK